MINELLPKEMAVVSGGEKEGEQNICLNRDEVVEISRTVCEEVYSNHTATKPHNMTSWQASWSGFEASSLVLVVGYYTYQLGKALRNVAPIKQD